MKTTVLLFGIATDLIGNASLEITLPENCSVSHFKELLTEQYPRLAKISAYAVAINESYAKQETLIKKNDIIAVIPPVSGG
ncbi:MoaD/ThiS family protein [Tenacibaculum finnmarkense]|uniref:Molybdopterin synthase sulfur carrier subunit n=1 Tax=Tenacibaculum finnmarkense genomovar ulcerans TaxID=2781388 RepID=A0A2I2LD62_9FLAO|nr:MoaD/ThiS family protein [Tenacibaculum finnmarkense]ALU73916.1 molybdopterin synthase sulfur carrier subunit [Tenacibaculum dicentrarchi]MBE7696805.1 molybdopterin synthase sulfur carrier subunit [Tenacibaculum finnmarkense genomovar ulcerans]MCD8421325.1 MoaD/ThiS family protein [Tenacibaculum finnmarkense genomovar ulcerans]MCD8432005.1 MoaD/ThiS family protein [Tenacibaculum finnmarkense genomovar ulcerans]MCG8237461.1 MoaD/ThiS family protein [Tenacibaculum finnmarkense genomovar ulcer